MADDDDWRLQGQESYLMGAVFAFARYTRWSAEWDHDHCSFCWAKFMVEDWPDVLHEGYSTAEGYWWVCPQCFEDFKERFQWKLVDEPAA